MAPATNTAAGGGGPLPVTTPRAPLTGSGSMGGEEGLSQAAVHGSGPISAHLPTAEQTAGSVGTAFDPSSSSK